MKDLLQNLSETLDRMIVKYNEILNIAQKKKEYIITGNVDKLETVIYQERNFAESILLLEEKRRYVLRSINDSLGNGNNSTKLKDLITQIREPHKSRLREQYDSIIDVITKVNRINDINTSLTKYTLEYINSLVKAICTESLNDNTYQQSGKLKEPEIKRILFEINA